MCSFASNVIGSHRAPPDATLLHFFSKNIFRTLFFCTRSQKGNFKAFPTKWYTFSLFQSATCPRAFNPHTAPRPRALGYGGGAKGIAGGQALARGMAGVGLRVLWGACRAGGWLRRRRGGGGPSGGSS